MSEYYIYDNLVDKLVSDGYVKYFSKINFDYWCNGYNRIEVEHYNHCIVLSFKLYTVDYLL